MVIEQTRRIYWTVARRISDKELYVESRERFHFGSSAEAQIEVDARNIELKYSDNVIAPDSPFFVVEVLKMSSIRVV